MIRGIVTDQREALIPLTVLGTRDRNSDVEAIVDTGYDGFLTLPRKLIKQFGLHWRRRGKAELADGTGIAFDVYEAIVLWDGKPRRVEVDEAETVPLVGMTMLEGHELKMRVQDSGSVEIRQLNH